MNIDSISLKRTARLAGVLYLLFIALGLYIDFYLPSQVKMAGGPVTVAHNVLSHEFLFRTGIMAHILTNTVWLFLVMVLYKLFKPVDRNQAMLMLILVIVQLPTVFALEAMNIASLAIFKGEILKMFELSQRQDIAILFHSIGDYVNTTQELFWGLWLFPLAILVYKSRFLPRFLGVWLIINGVAYLVLSFVSVLWPQYGGSLFQYSQPALLGEVAFMLWLLIMGAKLPTMQNASAG